MSGGFMVLALVSYMKDGVVDGIMDNYYVNAEPEKGEWTWQDKKYQQRQWYNLTNGFVEEYLEEGSELCTR